MQVETLFILPLGVVLIVLLGVLGLAVLTGMRIGRRGIKKAGWNSTDRLREVLDKLPFGILWVTPYDPSAVYNKAALRIPSISSSGRLPDELAEIASRVMEANVPEVTTLPLGQEGDPTRVEAIPIHARGEAGALFLLNSGDSDREIEAQYRSLLGALSHELRTPLTAIMGHMDILASSGPEEEDLRLRSQHFISAEVARLARLVEDLLRLSRLESTPVHIRPINPRSVVEEAISTLHEVAEGRAVTVLLRGSANLPRVQADPDRLQQVIINLLDNAIKFTPEGGAVEVRLDSADGGVRIEVSDEGPGIPLEDHPHLFEPFYRSDRRNRLKMQGTGLGLAIVKTILSQHRAQIVVESTPGQGARFSFTLPSARSFP